MEANINANANDVIRLLTKLLGYYPIGKPKDCKVIGTILSAEYQPSAHMTNPSNAKYLLRVLTKDNNVVHIITKVSILYDAKQIEVEEFVGKKVSISYLYFQSGVYYRPLGANMVKKIVTIPESHAGKIFILNT